MLYSDLVKVYEDLEKTTKRLEKTEIISKFLEKVPSDCLKEVIYLLQGDVFPHWDERKLGFSSRLMLKAISLSSGVNFKEVEKLWTKAGDLGIVAENLIKNKKQRTLVSKGLTIEKIIGNLRKISTFEGQGTVDKKISLVVELINCAEPTEARFIVRTVLGVLRVGVASGILRDSIAKTFNKEIKDVEEAYNNFIDYGEVALSAKNDKLKSIGLIVGRPCKAMLAIRVNSILEAFKAVGKPALFDFKLDGFRAMIHYTGKNFFIFTRRQENVTNQFKELILILKENVKGKNYILDTELVGYDIKSGRYLPFQNISQRIKRKYNIEEMARKFPVEINVFDILYYNDKDLREKKQTERRKLIEKIVKEKEKRIVVVEKLVSDNEDEVEKFYERSLRNGFEGIVCKNLESNYKAGRYVNGWVKLKGVMENLDLVITGGLWGEGKRAKWLSSFILSCKSGNKFLEIGKVGTGIKEKNLFRKNVHEKKPLEGVTFKELTKLLKPLIVKEEGKKVFIKPKVIVEVGYEEIQKSPTYSSGYALRFPKIKFLRLDKPLNEVSSLKEVEILYKGQRR